MIFYYFFVYEYVYRERSLKGGFWNVCMHIQQVGDWIGLKIEIYGVFRCSEIPQKFHFFRRQKIYFFRVQIFFAHFFSRKNSIFSRNLKNIGIFKNKKTKIFWTRKFEFKKNPEYVFKKIFDFQKKSKFSKTFFEKKLRKIFWTRKNNFVVDENFKHFQDTPQHLKTS